MHSSKICKSGKPLIRVLLLSLLGSTASAQTAKPVVTSPFTQCWQKGIIAKQRACVAHIYLGRAAAILELQRAPEVKPRSTAEATVQAMLTDLLFRQREKAMHFRSLCQDLQSATVGGDSIATQTTELICSALRSAEYADSLSTENILAQVEPDGTSIIDRARAEADVASTNKNASRLLLTSGIALTYMLVEFTEANTTQLAMSKAERDALISHSLKIFPGEKVRKARFVLEQSIEQLRTFLQQNWSTK